MEESGVRVVVPLEADRPVEEGGVRGVVPLLADRPTVCVARAVTERL